MLTLQLDLLPVLFHLFCILNMFVTKDMRMAHNHLFADAVKHVGNVEGTLLLPYLGVKNKMQHEVAEFFLHLDEVVVEDGLAEFVGLLNGEMTQAVDGLGAVPRASRAHRGHDIQ